MFWRRRKSAGDKRRWVIDVIPRDARCAEVGVWKGDFSAQVLSLASPRELHLIDPWLFNPAFPKRWYGGAQAANQSDMDAIHNGVVQRFASAPQVAVHRQSSLDAAASFADASFDWVYIDGDHSYEAVKADLAAWFGKVKLGGALTGDDCDWRDESGLLSVQHAVDEFVSENRLGSAKIEAGQFVIRRVASPA